MICRYCGGPGKGENEMCLDCKRRYNRLSGNKSKLLKAANNYERAKYLRKVLDDLAHYRALQQAGFVVPNVVAEALDLFADVPEPAIVCPCCDTEVEALRDGRVMCEDCYRLYNNLNSLYYRPKRCTAPRTRQAYRDLLDQVVDRLDAGLRVPGFAVTILREEGLYAGTMEADNTRATGYAHIKRKDGA